jgi:ribose transport system substrate-binding protein
MRLSTSRLSCLSLFAAAVLVAVVGCKPKDQANAGGGTSGDVPEFTFVTNGSSAFWNHSEAGCRKAEEDFNCEVTFQRPKDNADQTRMLEDLISRGVDGVAITSVDPANQTELLNKVGESTLLVTHDSDAPDSNRLVYIGMDNYDAGWMAGELVLKSVPDGGKIALFIGLMDQDNSKARRQGCIDCILGREKDRTRFDAQGETLTSDDGKYTILGTLVDGNDIPKAKSLAEDALNRNPDLAAMIGLWEYNPPAILEALTQAGKLGEVKVIGFDENDQTLQGIKDGTVVGTVVQDPYNYGYKSIEVLSELHKGNEDVIPESKFIDIPARTITKENVDDFWAITKERLSQK